MRPQPEKLAVVHAWTTPTNPTEVRSFLGLCGFYQRFMAGYATVAAPLTSLLKKSLQWNCGEAEENAFQQLKRQLLTAPVMVIPDAKKPYYLHSDASEVGI